MNKVKVIIPGYAKINQDGTWDATSNTTLIDTGRVKIVVDPGCNRQLLLKALKKENLNTKEIDDIFLTHYHPDHCLLAGIFEKATVFDAVQWQQDSLGGDLQSDTIPKTDIRIIKTPGHTPDHASLLVETAQGKVLVGGDIFWWMANEKQELVVNKHDDFASDMRLLIQSRKKVLKLADFIIPGHGKMFRVK